MFFSKRAYTTPEVILVILLIAVCLAITLPRFGAGAVFNNYRLKTTVYNIASDMRLARQEAISNASTYIIKFDFAQNEYRVYKGSIAPANQVGETRAIPKQVAGSGTDEYSFTSLGEANWPSGTGQVTFSTSGGWQYRITVTRATGTARLEKL